MSSSIDKLWEPGRNGKEEIRRIKMCFMEEQWKIWKHCLIFKMLFHYWKSVIVYKFNKNLFWQLLHFSDIHKCILLIYMIHYFLKTYSYKNNLQGHLVQCPQLIKDKKIDLAHYFLVLCLVTQLCPTLYNPMDCSPPGSSVYGDSPGKNTVESGHALFQEIFLTQGLNPGLPHCRQILYHLSHPI